MPQRERRSSIVPGMKLGPYEILSRFAVGGMAEIFAARDPQGQPIVLKRLLPEFTRNEEFLRLFFDEAQILATLDHPNIARVYDRDIVDNHYFFTMEYVQGKDMLTVIRRTLRAGSQLPLEHALTVVCSAAAGLHYAHDKRASDGRPYDIVHRDISHSNLLVRRDGVVKIIDFGVGKSKNLGSAFTVVSSFKGKIRYMSPEQCGGGQLDRRTDIFSLGVVLYELTTGKMAFAGPNEAAIIRKIVLDGVDPPSTRVENYPPELEAIVMRALARERDQRYSSADEFRVDLEAFARNRGLELSESALSTFLHEIFGKELDAPWEENNGSPGEVSQVSTPPEPIPSLSPLRVDSGRSHIPTRLAVRAPLRSSPEPTPRMSPGAPSTAYGSRTQGTSAWHPPPPNEPVHSSDRKREMRAWQSDLVHRKKGNDRRMGILLALLVLGIVGIGLALSARGQDRVPKFGKGRDSGEQTTEPRAP